MKGNIQRKLTFEDSTEKQWIKSYFKGWAKSKRINRRLFRRRLNELCRKNQDVSLRDDG